MGYVIYTDGSCSGNPGPGGFGVVIIDTKINKIVDAHVERCDQTTNNREELKAIIWALENFGNCEDYSVVYSDSAYCVNTFNTWMKNWKTNGWKRPKNKPVENLDLIQKYDKLISKGYQIDLRKVEGHSGIVYNEIADGLATGRLKVEEILLL